MDIKKPPPSLEEALFDGMEVEALSKENRGRPSLNSVASYQVHPGRSIPQADGRFRKNAIRSSAAAARRPQRGVVRSAAGQMFQERRS
jgi:hypothetical protein